MFSATSHHNSSFRPKRSEVEKPAVKPVALILQWNFVALAQQQDVVSK